MSHERSTMSKDRLINDELKRNFQYIQNYLLELDKLLVEARKNENAENEEIYHIKGKELINLLRDTSHKINTLSSKSLRNSFYKHLKVIMKGLKDMNNEIIKLRKGKESVTAFDLEVKKIKTYINNKIYNNNESKGEYQGRFVSYFYNGENLQGIRESDQIRLDELLAKKLQEEESSYLVNDVKEKKRI